LRPELTEADVIAGCELAKKYDVASVCVKPCHVRLVARLLDGSDVKVGTVISFPHGNSTTVIKVAEARQTMSDGAVELDMVINRYPPDAQERRSSRPGESRPRGPHAGIGTGDDRRGRYQNGGDCYCNHP
jgi:deoxyribose-phosphate aldolase